MSFASTSNDTLIIDKETIIETRPECIDDSICQGRMPRRLRKTFWSTVSLFCVGFILLVVAVEEVIRTGELSSSYGFLAISVIVLIPGLYYLVMFVKAKKEKDKDIKRELYDDIPVL